MQEHIFDNRIYYRKNDWQKDRATLVIVHGVSGSSSAWLPYEKNFQEKYNLLTYDIRGHGMSKKYPNYEDYEIKNFVSDLEELLNYLNVEKCILYSCSFGTLIAREYLKQHRENVTALIFSSTENFNKFQLKILRPLMKIATDTISLFPFNPKPRGHVDYSKTKNSDWSIERNLADTRNTGLRSQFYSIRQSFNNIEENDLEEINIPTLIIHGEKDSIVPIKNAIAFAKKIKNAKFQTIQNLDHDIHHNAVTQMTNMIESFIEENKLC